MARSSTTRGRRLSAAEVHEHRKDASVVVRLAPFNEAAIQHYDSRDLPVNLYYAG